MQNSLSNQMETLKTEYESHAGMYCVYVYSGTSNSGPSE